MATVLGPRHSRQIVAYHHGHTASQHAILAATTSVPYYQAVIQSATQQDLQPDRPIGYGAFGVVWYVTRSELVIVFVFFKLNLSY